MTSIMKKAQGVYSGGKTALPQVESRIEERIAEFNTFGSFRDLGGTTWLTSLGKCGSQLMEIQRWKLGYLSASKFHIELGISALRSSKFWKARSTVTICNTLWQDPVQRFNTWLFFQILLRGAQKQFKMGLSLVTPEDGNSQPISYSCRMSLEMCRQNWWIKWICKSKTHPSLLDKSSRCD